MRRYQCLASALLAAFTLAAASPNAAFAFDWSGRVAVDAAPLSDPSLDVRLKALTVLASYDPALTEPYLLAALAEPDDEIIDLDKYDLIRIEAAKQLGRNRSQKVVPIMIEWSADISPELRRVAAEVLGSVGGDEATAALVRSLGDLDSEVRLRTVNSLALIGVAGDGKVVIPLVTRLGDEKVEVRRRAVEVLAVLGDRRAVIPLVSSVGDSSFEVRKAAVLALGVLGDKAAVPALLRTLRDSSDEMQVRAIAALGAIGDPDALPSLLAEWSSAPVAVRAKLALAIGLIAKSPEAAQAAEPALATLVDALANSSQAPSAREALLSAGATAVPVLVEKLANRRGSDATAIVNLLREAADRRATSALIAELDRGRVELPLVIAALGATRDPAALMPVLGMLDHKDAAVRTSAMQALTGLVGDDARAADVLALRLDDEDPAIRALAAEHLGATKAAVAVEPLIAHTLPGQPIAVRRAAITALGEIGDKRAAPALITVLREGPGDLHRAAADALLFVVDDSSVDTLMQLARAEKGASQGHIVRILAAIARRDKTPRVLKLLADLAVSAGGPASAAAINGLAAAGDLAALPALTKLATEAAPDRRRLAAWALGVIGDTSSLPTLLSLLAVNNDRVVADAAWALGELAAHSEASRAAVLAQGTVGKLLKAVRHGGWATNISAVGALARIASVASDSELATMFTQVADAERLLFAGQRLVRVNAARLIGELNRVGSQLPSPNALAALGDLVASDPSPRVRAAAARALTRIADGKPARIESTRGALQGAATQSSDKILAAAASAALAGTAAKPLPPRDEWRTFFVVDASRDDAPVPQDPYFVIGADHLVWATYTDAKGEITAEYFPAGDAEVVSAAAEDES